MQDVGGVFGGIFIRWYQFLLRRKVKSERLKAATVKTFVLSSFVLYPQNIPSAFRPEITE
jgi:hypothetical protein